MKTILNFIIFILVTSSLVSCRKTSIIPDNDPNAEECIYKNLGSVEVNSEKFQSVDAFTKNYNFDENKQMVYFSIIGTNEKACDGRKAFITFGVNREKSDTLDKTYKIQEDEQIEDVTVNVQYLYASLESGTVTINSIDVDKYKIYINGTSEEGKNFSISVVSNFDRQ